MEKHNKTYAYTIIVKELRETVPNLFRYASAYKRIKKIKDSTLWPLFSIKAEKKKEVKPGDPLPDIDYEMMENEKYK